MDNALFLCLIAVAVGAHCLLRGFRTPKDKTYETEDGPTRVRTAWWAVGAGLIGYGLYALWLTR